MAQAVRTTTNDFPLWETQVLEDLGTNPTTSKLEVLNWWSRAEGLPAGAHNPLAITESYPNEWGQTGTDPLVKNDVVSPGVWNSAGVVTYPTDQAGAAATADFIQHGHPLVSSVLTSPDPSPQQIVKAIQKDGAWAGDNAQLGQDAGLAASGQLTSIYTGGAAPGSASGVICSSKGDILDIPSVDLGLFSTPKINLFTYCNLKAIAGGMAVGIGLVTLFVGLGVVVQSETARKTLAASVKATRGPFGKVNAITRSGLSSFTSSLSRRG